MYVCIIWITNPVTTSLYEIKCKQYILVRHKTEYHIFLEIFEEKNMKLNSC